MQKGIKFRIYPNKGQKAFIHQTLGCCRFIYNRGLAMRRFHRITAVIAGS